MIASRLGYSNRSSTLSLFIHISKNRMSTANLAQLSFAHLNEATFFDSASPFATVLAHSELHDFSLCAIHFDVEFRDTAYFIFRVPSGWFDLADSGWTVDWPSGYLKLSGVRSFSGENLRSFNLGPAPVHTALLEATADGSRLLLLMRGHTNSESDDPRIAVEFAGDSVVKFFAANGTEVQWPQAT